MPPLPAPNMHLGDVMVLITTVYNLYFLLLEIARFLCWALPLLSWIRTLPRVVSLLVECILSLCEIWMRWEWGRFEAQEWIVGSVRVGCFH
ncbi:hypothetical protein AOQ84DRAFT_392621 [Glonium stellatum]|uniref:Uncharacterized protein n=1 Tax=Glonium stellatum TaxID=574774 RepID=A0A8E2ERA2_9PEZI|nr:hypothetical protein AOQ84DRAFT_392621 [Glonium stellatum]